MSIFAAPFYANQVQFSCLENMLAKKNLREHLKIPRIFGSARNGAAGLLEAMCCSFCFIDTAKNEWQSFSMQNKSSHTKKGAINIADSVLALYCLVLFSFAYKTLQPQTKSTRNIIASLCYIRI